jgi:iron complex outermembrane receptor protein
MNRITADVNTPLNKEKTALARFNVAAYSQDSFQDAGYNKGLFFQEVCLYKVSDKTTVTLDTEFHARKKLECLCKKFRKAKLPFYEGSGGGVQESIYK